MILEISNTLSTLFDELKDKIKAGEVPDNEKGDATLHEFKKKVEKYINVSSDELPPLPEIEMGTLRLDSEAK